MKLLMGFHHIHGFDKQVEVHKSISTGINEIWNKSLEVSNSSPCVSTM